MQNLVRTRVPITEPPKILIHHTAERDHPTSKVLENNERPRYVEDESTNYLGKKNKQQMIIDKINIIITSH